MNCRRRYEYREEVLRYTVQFAPRWGSWSCGLGGVGAWGRGQGIGLGRAPALPVNLSTRPLLSEGARAESLLTQSALSAVLLHLLTSSPPDTSIIHRDMFPTQ